MRLDIKEIADKADMIVNGYAFTRDGEYIRCDTLTHKHRSMRVKLHRLMAMRC